jgi:hypothetical protein
MITKRIKQWLFKEEIARFEESSRNYEEKMSSFADNLCIKDLVRENLKGFDPKLLDSEDDLPEILGETEEQESFLSKMKSLSENKELELLISYLVRNQIRFSVIEAENLEAMNFGRATINGLTLLQDEIKRLATVYDERHAPKQKFNEFEVV